MEYISVREAAQKLNVTERAIQKWAKQGKIQGAHKFSGAWVIPKDFAVCDTEEQKPPKKTNNYVVHVQRL